MTSLRRPRSLLLYSGTFHTGVISVADKQSWVPLFSLNLILCGHFQTYWKHVFGGFLQLDSVTLICHGLRHWLLFVGRVGCFHGFAVMCDVTSSIFVVSRLPFLPLGFFFLFVVVVDRGN